MCLLQIGDESPDICICSLSQPPPPPPPPPHMYVSKCVYVYVHISLFLPECACTTIIDISPRIFSLMYCCCVSIIIVICICPPGALIWLINLFLFLFHKRRLFLALHQLVIEMKLPCKLHRNKDIYIINCIWRICCSTHYPYPK